MTETECAGNILTPHPGRATAHTAPLFRIRTSSALKRPLPSKRRRAGELEADSDLNAPTTHVLTERSTRPRQSAESGRVLTGDSANRSGPWREVPGSRLTVEQCLKCLNSSESSRDIPEIPVMQAKRLSCASLHPPQAYSHTSAGANAGPRSEYAKPS